MCGVLLSAVALCEESIEVPPAVQTEKNYGDSAPPRHRLFLSCVWHLFQFLDLIPEFCGTFVIFVLYRIVQVPAEFY